MFTIPITGELANSRTRFLTDSSFCEATWAVVTTSQIPHRGTHRRLDVGGLDVEPTALELPQDPPHQEIEVLGDVLGGHVPSPDGGVERPLVPGPDLHGAAHRVDLRARVRPRGHGPGHLPPGPEDDAEPFPDHGHQRGLRDEEVERLREAFRLLLVPRGRPALL